MRESVNESFLENQQITYKNDLLTNQTFSSFSSFSYYFTSEDFKYIIQVPMKAI